MGEKTPACMAFGACQALVGILVFVHVIMAIVGLSAPQENKAAGAWGDLPKENDPSDDTVGIVCAKSASDCLGQSVETLGGVCYFAPPTVVRPSWTQANSSCGEMNGTLVQIDSQAVNDVVLRVCEAASGGARSCYIGLHQPNGGPGTAGWEWIDGTSPVWTNWYDGEWKEPSDNDAAREKPTNARSARLGKVAGVMRRRLESGEEDSAAMFTSKVDDEIAQGRTMFVIGRTVSIVIVVVVACISVVAGGVGASKEHKCCVICSTSGHGTCGGLMLCLAALSLLGGGFNFIVWLLSLSMIIGSCVGCYFCCALGKAPTLVQVQQPSHNQAEVVGQPVVGQPVKA
jgi:hypothetical protein